MACMNCVREKVAVLDQVFSEMSHSPGFRVTDQDYSDIVDIMNAECPQCEDYQIGKYRFSYSVNGKPFIQKNDGEWMEIKKKKFEALLDKFWEEEF